MKVLHRVLGILVGISCTGLTHTVYLYISNKTDRVFFATARRDFTKDDLVQILPGQANVEIENITPTDKLHIFWDNKGKLELWRKYRITLGAQREEPIYFTIIGSVCDGFKLRDVLNEPGEGGYEVQQMYQKREPARVCPQR